jgi:Ca2+-binding RTX toxin-like protein
MVAKFGRTNAALKHASASAARAMMQPLEERRLFAGVAPEALKVVDVSGPVDEMVEAGGQIYVTAPLASGGSIVRIYATDGIQKHTKLLLDLSQPGMGISAIGELTATEDGRVLFTASAVGGRHLFELNTANGKVHQITSGTNKFYTNVEAAGTRIFFQEGNTDVICTLAPGSIEVTEVTTLNVDTDFQAAGSVVFFIGPSESLYRSDGTAAGTVKVSGDYRVTRGDFFTSNEFVVFEGDKDDENTSLFIVGIGGAAPQKVADDFSLFNNQHAELHGWTYFSGGFYNTSPNANGRQLYRVNAAGVLELASKVDGGGQVEGISAIGNFVYFTANDGENLPSQGIGDRELYKLDTIKKTTKLITTGNQQYPIETGGGGALSSYFFVAAPDKENARFGSRALYRTNPVTDAVELVQGMPTVKDLNGKDYQRVRATAVGASGFFFTADTADVGRESDVFFSYSPFSVLDPVTGLLTLTGTGFADYTTMRVEGTDLILTQNGYEERHAIASVNRIEAFLGEGNDAFASDPSVFVPTYIFGDMGEDRMIGGSGNDTLTGGGGRSTMYGGAGDDRINGAGGRDVILGENGVDRIYGNGGNDVLVGGAHVDWIWAGAGDDVARGGFSADKIFGEDGNDSLFGEHGLDWLVGGLGDDQLVGGTEVDTLEGNEGNDQLFSQDTLLDNLFGGDGTDSALMDPTEAVVDLIETVL